MSQVSQVSEDVSEGGEPSEGEEQELESPYDDSGQDEHYDPEKDQDPGDDTDSDSNKDEELEDLLSNPNIPQKQRSLMKKFIMERIERERRENQKGGVKSKYSVDTKKPDKETHISPHKSKVKPSKKRKADTGKSSPVPTKVPRYSGASFLEESDSDASIDVVSQAKDVHSPSRLPHVATKRRHLTPIKKRTDKKGSSNTSSKTATPLRKKQTPTTSTGLSTKSGPSTSHKQPSMRERDVSTPSTSKSNITAKGKKSKYANQSTPHKTQGRSMPSPVSSPIQAHAATPAYVSSKYKAVWLPYEGDSEEEYDENGGKKKKKYPNWSEEEKETLYRIANHFKTDINGEHKGLSTEERNKKKLIAFTKITEGVNAVGGHNRKIRHVLGKFGDHKSTTKFDLVKRAAKYNRSGAAGGEDVLEDLKLSEKMCLAFHGQAYCGVLPGADVFNVDADGDSEGELNASQEMYLDMSEGQRKQKEASKKYKEERKAEKKIQKEIYGVTQSMFKLDPKQCTKEQEKKIKDYVPRRKVVATKGRKKDPVTPPQEDASRETPVKVTSKGPTPRRSPRNTSTVSSDAKPSASGESPADRNASISDILSEIETPPKVKSRDSKEPTSSRRTLKYKPPESKKKIEETPPSPDETAYDDDGATGIEYEDVEEQIEGSMHSHHSESVNKEQSDSKGEGVVVLEESDGERGGEKPVTVPVASFYSSGKDVKSKVASDTTAKETNVENINITHPKKTKSTTQHTPHQEANPKTVVRKGASIDTAMPVNLAPIQKKVDTMERRMTDTISVSMQSVQGTLTSVNTKSDALNARIAGMEDSLQGITNKIRSMKVEIHDDIASLSRDLNKLRLTVDNANVTTKEVTGLKTIKFSLGIESDAKTMVSKETQCDDISQGKDFVSTGTQYNPQDFLSAVNEEEDGVVAGEIQPPEAEKLPQNPDTESQPVTQHTETECEPVRKERERESEAVRQDTETESHPIIQEESQPLATNTETEWEDDIHIGTASQPVTPDTIKKVAQVLVALQDVVDVSPQLSQDAHEGATELPIDANPCDSDVIPPSQVAGPKFKCIPRLPGGFIREEDDSDIETADQTQHLYCETQDGQQVLYTQVDVHTEECEGQGDGDMGKQGIDSERQSDDNETEDPTAEPVGIKTGENKKVKERMQKFEKRLLGNLSGDVGDAKARRSSRIRKKQHKASE